MPGDGNCLFYSILVTAKKVSKLPQTIGSVSDIRSLLRHHLSHLSRAGQLDSLYRRDWLASCLYDIDDKRVKDYCSDAMNSSLQSFTASDMELFLSPLRKFVSNWANMIGSTHWGGLLCVELSILSGILQSVIEVWQETSSHDPIHATLDVIRACHTGLGNKSICLYQTVVHNPIHTALPSANDHFLAPTSVSNSSTGWNGPYPVLRLTLNDRHYNACTSRHNNSIPPIRETCNYFPSCEFFSYQQTIVEPYAALSREEKVYYDKALNLIDVWRKATESSSGEGHHADSVVMQTKCTQLTLSKLSHLEVPPPIIIDNSEYMINDEIMTSYMYLLERRSDHFNSRLNTKHASKPPKCRYLHSWFYKSICRGPNGPRSRKQRTDLKSYELLVIPALVDGHWALAICYLKESTIGVYDPLHARREDVFNVVRTWAEMQLPSREDKEWNFMVLKEQGGNTQKGNIDCGIYVCKAAESFGLGLPLRMSQKDIEYIRKRMMVEFFRQKATDIHRHNN